MAVIAFAAVCFLVAFGLMLSIVKDESHRSRDELKREQRQFNNGPEL